MKGFIKRVFPKNETLRWILHCVRRNPLLFIVPVFHSLVATKKFTGCFLPLKIQIGFGQRIYIFKHKSAIVELAGILKVDSWGGNALRSSILLGEKSRLTIEGDFEIGPNVHISLAGNSKLYLGGKNASTASGITCNSRIMVEDSVSIGSDCIIAWDVFISDSDWHAIKGSVSTSPVLIGNNVWISHGASILKGSKIPSGCIVGAKSLVSKGFDVENSLIAGMPAKIIKYEVEWAR